MPKVAADCVVFDSEGRVALIRRKKPPYQGSYALPGGFLKDDESVETACARETKEEVNLDITNLRLIGVYSAPDRTTNERVISIAYLAEADPSKLQAGTDAESAEWVANWREQELAFDHRKVLEDAYALWKSGTKNSK